MYIINRDYKNTSFDEVVVRVASSIPENSKVISFTTFWFLAKASEFYCNSTRWTDKGYDDVNHFLGSGQPDFVILSTYLLEGKSGVAAREEPGSGMNSMQLFYQRISSFAIENGELIDSINTSGYGCITIWSLENM